MTGVVELLRRHIAGRTERDPGRGIRHGGVQVGHDLGQAQVGQLHRAGRREQDVRRLDIPVDHADLVERRAQRPGGGLGNLQGPRDRHRLALLDVVRQALAVHKFHHDIIMSLGLAAVEHPHDSRVVQPGGEPCFAEEPLRPLGRLDPLRVEELHGHVQVEVRVMPLVDDPHPSLAEPRQDPAMANVRQSQVGIVGHHFDLIECFEANLTLEGIHASGSGCPGPLMMGDRSTTILPRTTAASPTIAFPVASRRKKTAAHLPPRPFPEMVGDRGASG